MAEVDLQSLDMWLPFSVALDFWEDTWSTDWLKRELKSSYLIETKTKRDI